MSDIFFYKEGDPKSSQSPSSEMEPTCAPSATAAITRYDMVVYNDGELDPWPTESGEWVRYADLPKQSLPVEVGAIRVLSVDDSFCPNCGHNRDTSSVSSIDNEDGTNTCQRCGTSWREVDAPDMKREQDSPRD